MTATMNRPAGATPAPPHHGKTLNLTLKVWRQSGPNAAGHFDTIPATNISEDASFLEMLDVVNEQLNDEGKEPITFDHDCREGICGTCSLMINGQAHGPVSYTHLTLPTNREV